MAVEKTLEEDWECRWAVPEYGRPTRIDLPECGTQFSDMLVKYKDLFKTIPGIAQVEEFRIRTGDSKPVKVPPRLIPQAYYHEVNSQIKDMCDRNIIRLSSSPWLSPPVMVGKKDGTIRFCIEV